MEKERVESGMVAHVCDPSPQRQEDCKNSNPAWVINQDEWGVGLHWEILSRAKIFFFKFLILNFPLFSAVYLKVLLV